MIKLVVGALNKFLAKYREKTGYHWIRPLVPEDIVAIEIKTDDRGFRERTVTGGHLEFGGGLQEEDAKSLWEAVNEDQPTNLYQQLHFDVKNKLDLYETRVSVVLSYTLFENWLKNAFVTALSSGDYTEEEAKGIITDADGDYHSFKNILLNQLDHELGVRFKDYERYQQWENHAYELRNEVVHEGIDPRKSEAQRAYQEIKKAIQFIQSELSSELSGTAEDFEFVEIEESPFDERH
jgi:hypothetical protein